MRMQEPEQWPSSEPGETTNQEEGVYRAETWQNPQEQKIYPQENVRLIIVFHHLIIGFAATGFGGSVLGLVGSAITLGNHDGSSALLTGGILGLVGSLLGLALFSTILILAATLETVRTARARRSRLR